MEATKKTLNDEPALQPHLMDYYYVLRKRMWLVLSTLFLIILFTALHTYSMKPVYRVTAKLLIDKETRKSPLTGQQLDYESYASEQLTFQTHFKIITSRPVLERVLAQMNLRDESFEPGLFTRFVTTVKANLKRLIAAVSPLSQKEEPLPPEELRLARRVRQLRSKIEIEGVRDTRLLSIHVEDNDPHIARDVANAVAETYALYDSDIRLESSRKMLDWLTKQLYDMRKKAADAERAFIAFKEKENLFSIEGKQKINVQKIEEMNASYIEARSKRLEVQAKIRELEKFIGAKESGKVRNIPTFINSKIIEDLYAELLQTEIEHRKISGVFKHKHPEMIKVTSKIQELRRKIRQQTEKALENAEAECAILIAREEALQEAMNRYEKEAIGTNRKELQYAVLEREVAANRELYNTLLAKIKETDITEEITRTNLRLVEPATVPPSPVKPKKARNLILSVIVGLFTGGGLAFFLEYLDQTVRNRDELEKTLGLPVFSEIPLQEKDHLKTKGNGKDLFPNLLDLPLTSHFSEAFKLLSTNLKFSGLDRPRRVYLVTSSVPKEGKSTTVFNLGVTLAQLGARALIIDTDLRKPAMKKIVPPINSGGLSDILVDTFSTEINSGTLGEWTIGDIHKLLEIQEKSGVVHYENQAHTFTVTFHKGRIINVDWPSNPLDRRLLEVLLPSGKVSEKQAEIAISRMNKTSLRLDQVLIHLGYLTPEEISGPLKLQLEENIRELHNCRHGRFTFQEEPRPVSPVSDSSEAALSKAMAELDGVSPAVYPLLSGRIQRHLQRVEDTNLWVLHCGKLPANPAEVLESYRMRALVDLLRDEFDVILLDSPPATTFSDAAVLASLSDAAILVMRAGSTNAREVRRAKEQLEAARTPIVGTVLNMLDFKRDPYYYSRYGYGYKYKYDAYYGKEDQKSPKRKSILSRAKRSSKSKKTRQT